MSRDPGSLWSPLPENGGPTYTKTQLIFHSTGTTASAAANYRYFARSDVSVESHFIVGLDASDPTRQVIDTAYKADANTTASRRAISIEVVGTGDMTFTPHQVSECIRICRWAAREHPIRERICPEHDASGFGWHVMFGAPGPWTTVRGKVCPGNRRIRQLTDDIFPAIFTTSQASRPVPAPPAPTPPEDFMAALNDDQQRELYNATIQTRTIAGGARAAAQQAVAEVAGLKAALSSGGTQGQALVAAAEQGARQALEKWEADLVAPGREG